MSAAHAPGTPHVALAAERKESRQFGATVELLRFPCSCGWKGVWYASLDYAQGSHARHVEQSAR